MMKGPKKTALAVRKPDGEIHTEINENKIYPWQKWIFVRGLFNFIDSLVTGYKYLMKSAEISMGDDALDESESKFDKWIDEKFGETGTKIIMGFASLLGVFLAIILFMVIPTGIASIINNFVQIGGWRTWIEGGLKVAILVGYMFAVSKMPEISRLFKYHGAEHKTIACYEAGEELTVENIRTKRRFHPRCGTSFILIVLLISILVGAILPSTSTIVRMALKILTLPLVVAVSYEIIKLCGRYDNAVTRAVSAPGLWLQHITTSEPDDSMIECAIAAMTLVIPEKKEDGEW